MLRLEWRYLARPSTLARTVAIFSLLVFSGCAHRLGGDGALEWSWGWRSRTLTGERFDAALTQNFIPAGQVQFNYGLASWHMVVTPEKKRPTIADFMFLREFESPRELSAANADGSSPALRDQEALVFRRGFSRATVMPWGDRVTSQNLLATPQALIVIPNELTWKASYNVVFLGQRPRKMAQDDYLGKFETYVNQVIPAYQTGGVRGYAVFVDQDYVCTLLAFNEKKDYDAFLGSAAGKKTFADAAGFLQTVMVAGQGPYQGQVAYDTFTHVTAP